MNRFGMLGVVCGSALLASTSAFALPKASELVGPMGFGINIGNTMEVPISSSCPNMSCWGNELPTEQYIKDIANAGFTSVRIPTAWYTHSDPETGTINESWLDSVYTVVKLVVDNGMYAFLNSHWDSGWLEDNVFAGEHSISDTEKATTDSAKVNKLQGLYWTQIANKFKDFDEHVIFGSANEPGVNDAWLKSGQVAFTQERMDLLKRYHETMINAVRATGGNNETRTIVVQAPRTDEAYALSLLANNMPSDPAGAGYIMAEFHFYPYQWSLMTEDADWGNCFYYWGEENYSTTDIAHNANRQKVISGSDTTYVLNENQYAGEAYTDSVFKALKEAFVDKGYPVTIGEYAAIRRMHLTGDNLRNHLNSRVTWYKRVNELSKQYGFIPFAWDTGAEGNNDNTIIYRQKGHSGIREPEVLDAMREAYGLTPLGGKSIDSLVTWSLDNTNRSAELTYTSVQSDSSETGTMRIEVGGANWSDYTAISYVMKVDVTDGPFASNNWGWHTISLFAMSGAGWVWCDYNLDNSDITNEWTEYKVAFSTDGLNFTKVDEETKKVASIKAVQAVGMNVYGTSLSGTILIDEVRLYKADGTYDVLADFNKSEPSVEGIASVQLVETEAGAATPKSVEGISTVRTIAASKMLVNVQSGMVTATFNASSTAPAKASLMNSLGQVIAQQNFTASKGANRIELRSNYRGPAMLMVKQGSQRYMQKVILK